MKRIVYFLVALMAMSACGNKTQQAPADTDSTAVNEVADSLNTVEAVVKQVNAVYDYWNELRQNYDESKPTVDDLFGSKEWKRVREEVAAIDRECECGGFFDFGDEGPLDPWTYDCYEGTVSANDIEAKLLPDGTAEVKFLVKDAVTIKGRPIRWTMCVEDGQWCVSNIIFVNDNNMDIIENMRAYAESMKQQNASATTSDSPEPESPLPESEFSKYAE